MDFMTKAINKLISCKNPISANPMFQITFELI